MSKHTQGPWFIWQELAMQREGLEPDEIHDELTYDGEFSIYAGNPIECTRSSLRGHSAHICDVDADNFDFDDDEEKCKENALATARLIAAAPELLRALKQMIAWEDGERTEIDAMANARAIVAKAEGEQQ